MMSNPSLKRLSLANFPYNEGVTRQQPKATVTLRDVAARAGVNATTVSVVLNGNRSGTRVSAATRERILAVAGELGYRPNIVARGMKHRRMNSLGVVDVMHGKGLNLYFLEVLNGILEKAAQYDQNTTVFTVSDWEADEEKIVQFCDGRVDGLIFIGPMFRPEFAETLYARLPFVALHSNKTLPVAISLEIDDEQGGYLATRHLAQLGHRRIAHFAGPANLSGAVHRRQGYERALAEFGIAPNDALILTGTFNSISGRESMEQLLQLPELPTAVFCANDHVAFGAMELLAERGLSVPDDISVVGFDDSLMARMTHPPLTTVCQPFRLLGEHAVELLLEQIGDTGNAPQSVAERLSADAVVREVFPVELIVRASTAPPR